MRETGAVAGPVCDDEAQEQTGVLRDKVETQLADDEQGEDSQALFAGAFAFGWVVPDQGEVDDGSLGPAWWYVSIVSMSIIGRQWNIPCVHLILCFQKAPKVLGAISYEMTFISWTAFLPLP